MQSWERENPPRRRNPDASSAFGVASEPERRVEGDQGAPGSTPEPLLPAAQPQVSVCRRAMARHARLWRARAAVQSWGGSSASLTVVQQPECRVCVRKPSLRWVRRFSDRAGYPEWRANFSRRIESPCGAKLPRTCHILRTGSHRRPASASRPIQLVAQDEPRSESVVSKPPRPRNAALHAETTSPPATHSATASGGASGSPLTTAPPATHAMNDPIRELFHGRCAIPLLAIVLFQVWSRLEVFSEWLQYLRSEHRRPAAESQEAAR